MSSVESYDGLCGWIAPFANSNMQIRCKHYFGHGGKHSWDTPNVAGKFSVFGGTSVTYVVSTDSEKKK